MYIITFAFLYMLAVILAIVVSHILWLNVNQVQCTMLPQNIRYNQHNSDQMVVVREANVIVRYYRTNTGTSFPLRSTRNFSLFALEWQM